MTNEAVDIPDLMGRIVEAGRCDGSNHVLVDIGRGQIVRVSGMSDELVRRFAMNLFKPVTLAFGIHNE